MNEIDNYKVGQRIRDIRKNKLGLSMAAFGERIDEKVQSGTVSNWETGKNLPNNQRIKKIALLGGKTVEELLYGKPIDYYQLFHQNKTEFMKLFNNKMNKYFNENTDLNYLIDNIGFDGLDADKKLYSIYRIWEKLIEYYIKQLKPEVSKELEHENVDDNHNLIRNYAISEINTTISNYVRKNENLNSELLIFVEDTARGDHDISYLYQLISHLAISRGVAISYIFNNIIDRAKLDISNVVIDRKPNDENNYYSENGIWKNKEIVNDSINYDDYLSVQNKLLEIQKYIENTFN